MRALSTERPMGIVTVSESISQETRFERVVTEFCTSNGTEPIIELVLGYGDDTWDIHLSKLYVSATGKVADAMDKLWDYLTQYESDHGDFRINY